MSQEVILLNEKELIELMKEVKENFPNEFFETIGYMKGLGARAKRKKDKSYVQQGTKDQ